MGTEVSTFEPGRLIGGFRLDERLHEGGAAHLWAVTAVDEAADRRMPLLMKVPLLDGEVSTNLVRFEVERMLMPHLTGPHVPRFVAHGDFHRQPSIVMERIEGETLRDRLRHAPLPIDDVVRLGASAADALHALHGQGVLHLGLDPAHLMVRASGEVVLLDFSLARHRQLPDLLDQEAGTWTLGSAAGTSPEQLRAVRHDPRSDLFSLGALLYQAATGETPFGAPSTRAGLRRRLYTEPRPPRVLRPDLPGWLQEVLLRCLETDPARRCETAAQLAFDLRHPDRIALTARSARLTRAGPLLTFGRWVKAAIP